MSAVAIQSGLLAGLTAARRGAPVTPVRPAAEVRPSVVTRSADAASINSSSAGHALAELHRSVDLAARVSGALAVADDRLSQIGEALSGETIDGAAIDRLAASARFGGSALLDGTYSATVRGQAITLPAVSSAEIESGLAGRVGEARRQIEAFRSGPLASAAYGFGEAAEALAAGGPSVDDPSEAGTNALLLRAKAVLDGAGVAGAVSPNARHVLALIG